MTGPIMRALSITVLAATIGSGLIAAALLSALLGAGIHPSGTANAATTNVNVGQTNGGGGDADEFNSAAITILEGDTVNFDWFDGVHDATAYVETVPGTPDWQSPLMTSSATFSQTFSTAGVVTYYCTIHASRADAAPGAVDANIASGDQMVGKITVEAAAADTPTPTDVPPTATPTDMPVEATATPTDVPPTATPTDTPIEASPTPTGVPPTATEVPPTATEVPPTATGISPTATDVPPTATGAPPTATPTTPLTNVPGDVDCSGFTNAIDAALILQLSASLVDALACDGNADLSRDGLIDSIDAAIVLQCVAALFDCSSLAGGS